MTPLIPIPPEHRMTVYSGIELALDFAYHNGTPRELAVAAEAWALAGYGDHSLDVYHASPGETLERVYAARRGRPRRLLRADARGLILGLVLLAAAGLISSRELNEARRIRWVQRGGHRGAFDIKAAS